MLKMTPENLYAILVTVGMVLSIVVAVVKHRKAGKMEQSAFLMTEVLPIVLKSLPKIEKVINKKIVNYDEFEGVAVDLLLEEIPEEVRTMLSQDTIAQLVRPWVKQLYDKAAKYRTNSGEPIGG